LSWLSRLNWLNRLGARLLLQGFDFGRVLLQLLLQRLLALLEPLQPLLQV
jgi:hypothetical protein